ncbi:MAG TPA: hypothetical protein VGC12_04245 [Methyloradius sp.]
MNKLLITLILAFPLLAFADSVPIQDQTTLPCDNSSSSTCGTSSTTNSPDPSAGQDASGINATRQIQSVTPSTRPSNTPVTPVPQPNTAPPVNAVPPLSTPASPSAPASSSTTVAPSSAPAPAR